jgi:hypothetical protein
MLFVSLAKGDTFVMSKGHSLPNGMDDESNDVEEIGTWASIVTPNSEEDTSYAGFVGDWMRIWLPSGDEGASDNSDSDPCI